MDIENYLKLMAEVHWDGKEGFLWIYVLEGCGCGSSDTLKQMAWDVFEMFAQEISDQRWQKIYEGDNALAYETLAHWIDSKGLIEHGGSIAGSWLTSGGKALYDALKEKP